MEYFGIKIRVNGKAGSRTYYFLARSDSINDAVGRAVNHLEFDMTEVRGIDIQVIRVNQFLEGNTVKQWM